MSNTDKTRPLFVRMMDPKDVKVGMVENHNHLKGYCDIPDRHDVKAVLEHFYETRHNYRDSCHYDFSYNGTNVCGCNMCTGKLSRRTERRAQRHTAKASLNNHKKLVNAGIVGVDDDEVVDVLEEIGNPNIKKLVNFW